MNDLGSHQLRPLYAMNILGLVVSSGSRSYEQVKVVDDMNDLVSHDLKPLDAMNSSVRFIKDFSKLSKPLCELLAKDAKFIWDERCQRSFDQLKQFLTTAPIVRAPNWQLPFEVMCDATLCDLLCKQDIERSSKELHNYRERIFQVSGKHKIGSTSLQRFMLIIGKSLFFSSIKSNKESSAIAMRMHVEATLPLRKQP
ncbi:hypothetical protein AAG906_029767 [Vitis piasezkii]